MKKQRRRAAAWKKHLPKKSRVQSTEFCVIPNERWQFAAPSRSSDFEIVGMGGTGSYIARLLSSDRKRSK